MVYMQCTKTKGLQSLIIETLHEVKLLHFIALERLINIDTDHIIPDKLHLLLCITDEMIENLINGAVAHDL